MIEHCLPFNLMLGTQSLNVCLPTTLRHSQVLKKGFSMSNYWVITAFAKLFTIMLQRRLVSWAEMHGTKVKVQACLQ